MRWTRIIPLAGLASIGSAQSSTTGPTVDLGYARYQATVNTTAGQNIWKGIRYGAPPTGDYRFREPRAPAVDRSSVIVADHIPNQCPQSPDRSSLTGAVSTAQNGNSSEDCLYLSIYSPINATNLPVLTWIHGGGYGQGNGSQDLTPIMAANNNSFVGVAIQYRLGAFGFLSSAELASNGTANAGIYDQVFALQWVQDHIGKFGGNASQVTIAGESAGGGSVMLLDMAYGGTLGTSLFRNTISASPYLPMQYDYRDSFPSQNYYAFAEAAGCSVASMAYRNSSTSVLQCLRNASSASLIDASAIISGSGQYGTWGFVPVTDGKLIQQLPSQQLQAKQVNGLNALIGNNADEGPLFVPTNIDTMDALVAWLRQTFPRFEESDIEKVLMYYPSSDDAASSSDPLFATWGNTGPTAINQSDVTTGLQQVADNIYAETTIVCPSYWMAEAYTNRGRSSYKYQYSVPVAFHGSDGSAYFGPPSIQQGEAFSYAFMRIWGAFITTDNPSISQAAADGGHSNETALTSAITQWPTFTIKAPYQMDLNTTGGTPYQTPSPFSSRNLTEHIDPGLQNNFTLVNAYTWEGGRGYRCDFWRSIGPLVPE